MSWLDLHRESERHASAAQLLSLKGETETARKRYLLAARAEEIALDAVEHSKRRTYSITAVSAVALAYKGGDFAQAKRLAHSSMATQILLPFAEDELQELLQTIWDEEARTQQEVNLANDHIHAALRGEQIFRGVAPFAVVERTFKRVEALLYRVAEREMHLDHRIRGNPPKEVTERYQPWIVQSVPGSYQFAITLGRPTQSQLWPEEGPTPSEIVARSHEIITAAATSPYGDLPGIVQEADYRQTFLKIARDLAPRGGSYDSLELEHSASARLLALTKSHREKLNGDIREMMAPFRESNAEPEELTGILRAVELNRDWLRLDVGGKTIHISGVRETVDDLIGPLINQPVIVTAIRDGQNRLRFVDIEPND